MNNFIATFYSHYDAMAFAQFLKSQGIEGKLMPTPRKVSASCGTCAAYSTNISIDPEDHEIEDIYIETPSGYEKSK